MLPEMQQRGCEVHVDYTAVVSKFERALEQLQKQMSYKIETHGSAWGLRIIKVWWFDNRGFCGLVHTHVVVHCRVNEDTLMPLHPMLLLEACARQFSTNS